MLFPETKKRFSEKCFGLEKQFMEKQKKVSRNFVSRMAYLSFLGIMPGNPIWALHLPFFTIFDL
ncbi:hypothetical protein ASF92_11340 [Pedobacter sp. Leaf176]|nr:hypothetical protein ASF92_11340 [Pedobacter sp. Leaf176]